MVVATGAVELAVGAVVAGASEADVEELVVPEVVVLADEAVDEVAVLDVLDELVVPVVALLLVVAVLAFAASCAMTVWFAEYATAPTPSAPAIARPAVMVLSVLVPDRRAAAPCMRRS